MEQSSFRTSLNFDKSLSDSLNFGSTESHILSKTTDNHELTPEEKLESLTSQIDEVTNTINSIKHSIEENEIRYKNDIQNLKQQLEDAKSQADSYIANQIAQNEKEQEEARNQYTKEIQDLENKLRETSVNNEKWGTLKMEIQDLGESAQKYDLDINNESQKAKHFEATAVNVVKKYQKQASQKAAIAQSLATFHQLQQEVSSLQSTRRQNFLELRQKTGQLDTNLASKAQEHSILVNSLRSELQKRQKQYKNHLNAIQDRVINEKNKSIAENQAAKQKIETLQKIYQNQTRKSTQQLQIMAKDIELMRKTLDDAKKAEEKSQNDKVQQQQKLVQLQQETEKLKTVSNEMEAEIKRLNTICQIANREIQRASHSNFNIFN